MESRRSDSIGYLIKKKGEEIYAVQTSETTSVCSFTDDREKAGTFATLDEAINRIIFISFLDIDYQFEVTAVHVRHIYETTPICVENEVRRGLEQYKKGMEAGQSTTITHTLGAMAKAHSAKKHTFYTEKVFEEYNERDAKYFGKRFKKS